MNTLVELLFQLPEGGSLETTGYTVSLTIRPHEFSASPNVSDSGIYVNESGTLPANPILAQQLQDWQNKYEQVVYPNGRCRAISNISISVTVDAKVCRDASKLLAQTFNNWLKSQSFMDVRESILKSLNRPDKIIFLIRSNDQTLRQLPWQKWEFLNTFTNSELAFGKERGRQRLIPDKRNSKIRILAILGHSEGINTEKDRQFFENLSPYAEVEFLPEPNRRDITEQLWENSWDIIFFAGHSNTVEEEGVIYLNSTDYLTIDELWLSLKKAVDKGLKLAIFNSCDGLGIARQLDEKDIPLMIVMRELVPDLVAQEFLKHFLKLFSEGKSFHLAVREARERLEGQQDEFPCATWLPVIYGDGILPPWQELYEPILPPIPPGEKFVRFVRSKILNPLTINRLIVALCVSLIVVMGVGFIRDLGFLETAELDTFDRLMRLRPPEEPDPRLVIIEVTPDDSQKYGQPPEISLLASNLSRVLKKLDEPQYSPAVIGVSITSQSPFLEKEAEYQYLIDRSENLGESEELPPFVTACGVSGKHSRSYNLSNIPEEWREYFVGFSEVISKVGEINQVKKRVRTDYLYDSTNNDDNEDYNPNCPVTDSFELLLALHYLDKKEISHKWLNADDKENVKLKIGSIIFNRLESDSGGYHKFDNGGFQILLNYRSLQQPHNYREGPKDIAATTITLDKFLNEGIEPELIKDKIVLIGVTQNEYKVGNIFDTPYGEMEAVTIQAHQISQIINAVDPLENNQPRPILKWWPQWSETLWILVWSLSGGILVWIFRNWISMSLSLLLLLSLFLSCYIFLIMGFWIPLFPPALALILSTLGTIFVYKTHNIKK